MQVIFYIISAYGLYFFICKRHQFDFVSTAYIGMLIYFMPAFYGYVNDLYRPFLLPSIPIYRETYIIFMAALAGIIITGTLYNPAPRTCGKKFITSDIFDATLLLVIAISFALLLFTGGQDIISTNKHVVLENINRFFIIFSTSTQLALIVFILQKKFIKAIIPLMCAGFLLFIGFRSDIALAMIAISTVIAYRNGIFAFLKPKYILPLMIMVITLFMYKAILYPYRYDRIDIVENQLATGAFISDALLKSEPFTAQTNLNEIVIRDFRVDPSSLLYSIPAIVPFLLPMINIDERDIGFNFQEQIFPHLSYGAGSNIYANFYAAFGPIGIVIFIVLHNLILVFLSKRIDTDSPYIFPLVLMLGAFFAFYIHRNDVLNSMSIIGRSAFTIFLVSVATKLLETPRRRQVEPASYHERS